MGESARRVLAGLVILAVLVWLDLLAAHRLTRGRLHLPVPVDAVESICPNPDGRLAELLAEHPGLGEAPCRDELHTGVDWMLRASPYPPFLGEYDSDYPAPEAASAVFSSGGRRLQVTVFSGAADTTPSRFVPSVRGEESYWNDHHPTYLFVHEAAESARPKLLFAAWESREVAGIEGRREMAIAVSLLVLEIAAAGLLLAAYRWRRPQRSRGTDTSLE